MEVLVGLDLLGTDLGASVIAHLHQSFERADHRACYRKDTQRFVEGGGDTDQSYSAIDQAMPGQVGQSSLYRPLP